ncbi:MAG: hypothetical protein WBO10_05040 [Pyrinomonadaceae bacterium]
MNSRYFCIFAAKLVVATLITAFAICEAVSQPAESAKYQSQEVSEIDGLPVLIKHLPDWENHRPQTTFATDIGQLKTALGERPILDLIDFSTGTEAVTAPYDVGKLLIIEYTSPQASIEADTNFLQFLADTGDATIAYRRIGNYNVLVFDVVDTDASSAFIDQVKYEKQVQWLGDNPFIISAERAFVLTTSDMFLSTAMVIVFGMGGSILVGIFAGYIFFTFRDGKRSKLGTFSDAGGMTRLNLDGFTPESRSQLLKD